MRNRYLLLVPTVCGQERPADSIISASEEIEALKAAITSVRAPRQPSRIAFRGLKRDALEAQIFDVAELRVVGTYHAMMGRWQDVPAAETAEPSSPSSTAAA